MVKILPVDPSPAGGESLAPFLAASANWSLDRPELTAAQALRDPQLSGYLAGWGRPGDIGVLAVADDGTGVLGAAWARIFPAAEAGAGFVSETIPELLVAVDRDSQGSGLGTRLLHALFGLLRYNGATGVSAGVAQTNSAIGLFARLGFREVGTGEGIAILLKDLCA
ncbi:GNAT family N-acetyltransferase [Brevibacterium sp. 50QC2O2]|uniref:GNAT family N-acetyltransferase n=1 Tax=Brevibacterium TaxID=1696 RepID=UPI00211BF41A|nr:MULTISPECIES: GNAT family N-acetyltransferase [unclassified Brevibacterium]MCQ9368995.1 GNAT family N-acetyltransferase [Brevibacterium sp. 91QC2O2]MCQ9384203.1 GNAT family N-acetyltransferase [Brevibacterium sp. 68QC2CO]MCQ9388318.1 GNAT family N-acetyltransferase [Brevibacterium sp. 50QC2O2]